MKPLFMAPQKCRFSASLGCHDGLPRCCLSRYCPDWSDRPSKYTSLSGSSQSISWGKDESKFSMNFSAISGALHGRTFQVSKSCQGSCCVLREWTQSELGKILRFLGGTMKRGFGWHPYFKKSLYFHVHYPPPISNPTSLPWKIENVE